MAEVDIFDYVTGRLDILKGDFGDLAQSHNDLRVRVAGIQTQLKLVYTIIILMLTGASGMFWHLVTHIAKLPLK